MRRSLRNALLRAEALLDRVFGAAANPARHLGALGFYLFWIVATSGIYLYAAYDTSVAGAHASVARLSADAWPAGNFVRALHRYASDAFALVVGLHLAREWLRDHARGFRWFSWLTGVPLAVLLFASGLGGYWLAWDTSAQFSLTATMEWLDALPLFGEPIARNFIDAGQLSDRLFSLLVFLHIGIPLALLGAMWVHVKRIGGPRTFPPRVLALGFAIALAVLCVVRPVSMSEPANLSTVAARVPLDWFYQAVHPALYATSAAWLWLATGATLLLLALLPWLPPTRRPPAARVDPANCNGCGRCQADCPYVAVTLQPIANAPGAPRRAVVDAALCASCGICAGACPSSTPFRSDAILRSGIDMPQRPLDGVRRELEHALASGKATRMIVFACACGADAAGLRDRATAVIALPCIAMLPPSFVEYALRSGAAGVLIAGCRQGDCEFRTGDRLTLERLARTRAPRLREGVDSRRIATVWTGPADGRAPMRALARLRAQVALLAPAREQRPKRQEAIDG